MFHSNIYFFHSVRVEWDFDLFWFQTLYQTVPEPEFEVFVRLGLRDKSKKREKRHVEIKLKCLRLKEGYENGMGYLYKWLCSEYKFSREIRTPLDTFGFSNPKSFYLIYKFDKVKPEINELDFQGCMLSTGVTNWIDQIMHNSIHAFDTVYTYWVVEKEFFLTSFSTVNKLKLNTHMTYKFYINGMRHENK